MVRRSVGLVFQNPDDQLFMPTVEEDVAFGPMNMNLPAEEVKRRVDVALDAMGVAELRDRASYELSGGQKRSVAVATVLSMEPDILVLDEPSSNLDPRARRLLMERIAGFKHTCVIVSHDMDMIRQLCPRTIMMCNRRIVADGDTQKLLDDRELLDSAGLI
jgi:cobalt/nickel transport system ATP-binding protein